MSNSQSFRMELRKLLIGSQLPALPQSAIRLLELSQEEGASVAQFALPIESDPGLAGQVLRFVNSSYFGFSREISTVKMAITMVGTRTIKNFALWSAVFSLIPNPRCGPFDLRILWQDSLRRALFSRAIAGLLGTKEKEESFSAALLQDFAIPLLAKAAPKAYVELLETRHKTGERLSALETKALGWTHAEAGGLIARQWSLPEQFAELIESHLDVRRWLAANDPEPGKVAVSMSSLLPMVADPNWTEAAELEAYYEKIRPAGGPSLVEMLQRVDREFADFSPVLKISAPRQSLVDCYQAVLAETRPPD